MGSVLENGSHSSSSWVHYSDVSIFLLGAVQWPYFTPNLWLRLRIWEYFLSYDLDGFFYLWSECGEAAVCDMRFGSRVLGLS